MTKNGKIIVIAVIAGVVRILLLMGLPLLVLTSTVYMNLKNVQRIEIPSEEMNQKLSEARRNWKDANFYIFVNDMSDPGSDILVGVKNKKLLVAVRNYSSALDSNGNYEEYERDLLGATRNRIEEILNLLEDEENRGDGKFYYDYNDQDIGELSFAEEKLLIRLCTTLESYAKGRIDNEDLMRRLDIIVDENNSTS